MKKYRIINKEARNTNQELKEYTFEELKSYFEPNKEMWDEEVYDEWHPKWEKIKDLYDLEEYLKEEADGMAVPYVFEEVNVKNSYKMSRPNVQKMLYKNVQLVCLL